MAPFPLTGATSLINKNDNNRNKMIFQHILEDVFQQPPPSLPLPPPTSPLSEIKRRFEWTLITQQNHLPSKITNPSISYTKNDTPSIATLVKLSLSSSSSSSSHDLHPLLKSPSPSSGPLIPFLSTHSHNDFFCPTDIFSLLHGIEAYFFGVDVLCLKFCAGRLTLIMSRKTCWTELKSSVEVIVTIGMCCCHKDNGFMDVNAGWLGIHHQKNHHRLLLLPTSTSTTLLTHGIKKMENAPDLVSWQKKNNDADDGIFFIDHDYPFPPDDPYPIVDFIMPGCHVEPDPFLLSPSISSTSTSSTSTSCTFLSPPCSPLFNATTTFPLYDQIEEEEEEESDDQYEPLANASLVSLIQETLQYIQSSPSHHSYSTELESLVPKMGNFLSHSL